MAFKDKIVLESELPQLEKEVYLGKKASLAYDNWLMHYIDTRYALLFEEFKNADHTTDMDLLRLSIQAISSIEQSIKQDIQTGNLASQQLNKSD